MFRKCFCFAPRTFHSATITVSLRVVNYNSRYFGAFNAHMILWNFNDVFIMIDKDVIAVIVVPVFDHQSIVLCERVIDEMGKHSFLKLD